MTAIALAVVAVICLRVGMWMGERNRDAFERVIRVGDTVVFHEAREHALGMKSLERFYSVKRVAGLDRTTDGHHVISWREIRRMPITHLEE